MCSPSDGGVAEWSCSGLQLRVRRFDSDLRLQIGNARVVKSVDTGDLKSPAHKACQFESGLGHHFSVLEIWCKKFQRKLVFLCLKIFALKIKKAKQNGLASTEIGLRYLLRCFHWQ